MKQKAIFKRWPITVMVLVLAADVAILLDVPILRQVLGFLWLTAIPGLLILYTLKLNRAGFLKGFLLSVGLSLVFLLFIGLLINTLLPWFGYSEPLSTPSLVVFLSLGIAILCFMAYWRNKEGIRFTFVSELGRDIKNKRLSLLLFPLLFPLLSVLGRNYMDTGGSNVILIVMFLLIPLYVILLMWQNKKIPKATYPLAIMMISIALLLARGLISNYLIGGDIYTEYHSFQIVSRNLHWSIAAWPNSVTASLSVSLLPTMFQSILGINPLLIYKVVFLILISLTPLIGYVIYERYVGHLYGFLSSFFFMAQIPFIYLLTGQIRVGMALVFFALALMVLFDDDIVGVNKAILFLIFIFSLAVTYYVLPIILLFLLFFLWLVPKISRGGFRFPNLITGYLIAILFVLIFLWWGQLTSTAFTSYVLFSREVLINLSYLFTEELYSPAVTGIYTIVPQPSLLMQVPSMVQRIAFAIIGIGVVFSVIMKELRAKFSNYLILMAACLTLLVAEMVLPWVSFGYGADRLYIQLLVILAPAFIVGCRVVSSGIYAVYIYSRRLVKFKVDDYSSERRQPRFDSLIVGLLAVSLFFSSSYLYNQLLGFPNREILDASGPEHAISYVYDSEVVAAQWLGASNAESLPVYVGTLTQPGSSWVFEYTDYGVDRKFGVYGFGAEPSDENSYVFLGHLSVVDERVHSPGIGILSPGESGPLAEYAYFFADKSKIYANGSAEIYR